MSQYDQSGLPCIEEEQSEDSIQEESIVSMSIDTVSHLNPDPITESSAHSVNDLSSENISFNPQNSKSTLVSANNLSQYYSVDYMNLKRKLNISLWEAVERNDIDMMKKLLDPKINGNLIADSNAPGLNNWTALHMASAYGLKEACEVLLYNGEATDINALTSMNRTSLHLATIHNHLNIVKLLIHEGAMINREDNDKNTCLHYASTQGYKDIVEWLLRKNPPLNVKNLLGRTPVDIALNYETYLVFYDHCKRENIEIPLTGYTRTIVHHTLMHNSREDQINSLLQKSSNKPNSNDLKVFSERPKLQKAKQNKKPINFNKFILPPSKVTPSDFRGLLQLGKGSFGEVYLVEKIDTLEKFALKVLRKEKVLGNNLVRYAFTERNILMSISHPFIVKLNYAFQTPEKLAIVMDFCPNGDLGTQLAREKRFSEEKARFYMIEILLALQELHNHGIIFRDLKPDNVVLDEEGHAKLTDFGLSKEGVDDDKLTKSFCGSVAYLAPEMIRRTGHSRSVDWYLFGVLLYEMIVGSPPYYSSSREQLFNNIQRGKLKMPTFVSNEARNLIKVLLQRDPNKRLGASKKDAEEVKADPFFKGTNWEAYMNKQVKPPSFHPIRRVFREVNLEKMFGKLEEEIPASRLDGWSVLQPS
ncbi:hypothetical protein SteCoe_15766 [Stentor coeruleus]|uniref:Protein kinase domain-containing protein n=1 Tax=Stentor coeruleus TaxID=5963 RepID=A0A1R2C2V2_9CILI|nr:hypothetical protein SteCoe_15766 [Stentor coeruleus]